MRTATVLAALSYAATAAAQAVEIGIEPSSPAPEGCDRSPKGNFTIGYVPVAVAARKRATALQDADGSFYLTLVDGVLTDGWNRTGSIVANRQFQFDGPPQAGAIYTGGFAVCQNRSLALGGTTRWWNCRSGTFNNLYDESIGAQCEEIRILATFVDGPVSAVPSSSSSSSSSSSTPASTSVEASSTAESSTTESIASSGNATASITSAAESASSTIDTIPITSVNGTEPSGDVSRVSSSEPTSSPTGNENTDAPPNNSAAPALSQGATFGAVVGVLIAALII